MNEGTADTFANRGDPLPLLTVTYDDVDAESSDTDSSRVSRRSRLRKKLSASRIREKAQALHAVTSEKAASSPTGKASVHDRLFNKLLEQVIPSEDHDEDEEVAKVDRRSSKYVTRPAFSLTTMSTNFRRFNARIGIVFVFQNRLIRLFTWTTTSHTLAFLAVYSFVCLDPYLLIVLPLAVALLFVMVPAFIARHPPPPSQQAAATTYNYSGPPIAPARTIRPAAETSKDFFRNMRDLQNSMADFSNGHDILIQYVAPATNFSDEVYSSTIFLYLFLLTCILFISAHLLPIRAILLIGGNTLIVAGHPRVQTWLVKQQKRAERRAVQYSDTLHPPSSTSTPTKPTGQVSPRFYGLPIPNNPTTRTIQSTLTTLSEITLSTAPETAEVEVFELQHRPLLPAGNTPPTTHLYNQRTSTSASEWQPHLFTPSAYDPLSPARLSGSRPKGTRFFEDVQPPTGWTWHTPKWELDLEAGEWVADRLIVGVEYDVLLHTTDPNHTTPTPTTTTTTTTSTSDSKSLSVTRRESINADFGGWVWDIAPPSRSTASGLERDEEVWLAYGDYHFGEQEEKEKEKEKEKAKRNANLNVNSKKRGNGNESGSGRDWEEQIRFGARGRTGEWRRRRWVRVVRRRDMRGDVA